MRLEPPYRLRFVYANSWETRLTGELGAEEQHCYLAEGRCEGPSPHAFVAHWRHDDARTPPLLPRFTV
jgi:hypothetical protein